MNQVSHHGQVRTPGPTPGAIFEYPYAFLEHYGTSTKRFIDRHSYGFIRRPDWRLDLRTDY